MDLPNKEEIIWALKASDREDNLEEMAKASEILNKLSLSRLRSNVGLYRCPLCGYETKVTNICRKCPKAPIGKDGFNLSVPMYVVEDTS